MASNESEIILTSRPEQEEIAENTSSSPAVVTMHEGTTPTTTSSSKSAAAGAPAGLIQRMENLSVSPPRQRNRTLPSGRLPTTNDVSSPSSGGGSLSTQRQLQLQMPPQQPVTRHFDLTPVTRNTSGENEFGDEDDLCMVVSPEDHALVGEHLAMPSNLSKETGPSLPRLANHRAKSAGHLDLSHLIRASNLSKTTTLESTLEPTMEPIAFPSDRKCYTFTSRQQYEDQHLVPTVEEDAPPAQHLRPYQPTRQELMDVGLAEDEVERIFTTRRNSLTPDHLAPIPLGDRQLSIPSIHMANKLNGSVASYTSYTDEEDYLLGRDDDTNSLSSRGSLYLPDAMELGAGEPLGVSSVFMPSVTLNGIDQIDDRRHQQLDASETATALTTNAIDGDARDRRQEKRSRKDEKALQWLRTVEAGDDVFAEAASSKFLTQTPKTNAAAVSAKTNAAGFLSMEYDPALSANRIIRRQTSSPPTLQASH